MSEENTHSRDWKTYAGHYFESGKKNKEYIDQAARYAQSAGDEIAPLLSELKDILWEIEDRRDGVGAAPDPSAVLKRKTKEIIINIVLALFFIIAGCFGLYLGTMNILSLILLIIGVFLGIFQIRSYVSAVNESKIKTVETDLKELTIKKDRLEQRILEKL